MAKGYQQEPGMDYNETFAFVVMYDSHLVLLTIITQENLELTQFDVKSAFLYGNLQEDILMKIPERLLIDESSKNCVCKLEKSLYSVFFVAL